jgi:hypothetical protein
MPREMVLRRGSERRLLLDVGVVCAVELPGTFAEPVVVAGEAPVPVPVTEGELEEEMDIEGLAVGATCEVARRGQEVERLHEDTIMDLLRLTGKCTVP